MRGGSGRRKWEGKWEGQTLSKGFALILSKQLYNKMTRLLRELRGPSGTDPGLEKALHCRETRYSGI